MATNLFETFDSAFARTERSTIGELIAACNRMIDGMLRRRQRARELQQLAAMPDHLLKDIGLVAWGGKLWPIAGGTGVRR